MADPRTILRQAARVLVLTGAGVSHASGVPTFRGADGLWNDVRVEDLATPAAFERDPVLVWQWYAWRRELIARCEPNAAHHALARFAASREGVTIVTQNVDGLHQAAARALPARLSPEARTRAWPLALHGDIHADRCSRCDYRATAGGRVDASSLDTLPRCPTCGALLRPAVVWFGEMLPERELRAAIAAARSASVCLMIGTSAQVQPAAGLATEVVQRGGALIEVDPNETMLTPVATVSIREDAAVAVPALLEADPPGAA